MNSLPKVATTSWFDSLVSYPSRALHRLMRFVTPGQSRLSNLEDTDLRMELVADNYKLADWEWDLQNNLLHFNREFVKKSGGVVNHGTVTTDWFLAKVHPQDRDAFVEEVTNYLANPVRKLELVFRIYDTEHQCLTVQCRGAVSARDEKRLIGIFTFLSGDEQVERKLNRYLQLEHLISKLSTQFLLATPSNFDSLIVSGLHDLVENVEGTRACLIHCTETPSCYEWGGPEFLSMTSYIETLDEGTINNLCQMLASDKAVFIPDSSLPSDVQKTLLENMTSNMVMAFPLKGIAAGKGCLLIGLDDLCEPWREDDLKLLQSVADLFFLLLEKQTVQKDLEARQELLLENQEIAKLGSWVLNAETKNLNCTPEVYRMFDLALDQDINYERFIGFVHPEDRKFVSDVILGAIESHGSYDINYRIVTSKNCVKHIQGRGQAIFDTKGNFLRRVGSVMDITERKIAEERIRISAILFDSTQEGVMITDENSKIIAVNNAFTEITGYSEQEALGEKPMMLKSGRHEACFYDEMYSALESDGLWQGEIWNKRKNGELYPEWLSINVVKNSDGNVSHQLAVFSDISKIKQSEEQLEHLSHHDPLTNLPNRLLFQSRLSHALDIAKRNQYKLAVLYIDLDHFKNINDSLGHAVGDELLIKTAQRLQYRVRESDTLARLGGDEFILLLEQVDGIEQVAYVAQSILDLLAEPFYLDSQQEVFIGASIGVSFFPNDGLTASEMISHSDAAVYQAKESGRNAVNFYTAKLTEAAHERLQLESELRRALAREDELQLYYQPQVSMDSGEIVGAEALIRWHHPEDGVIPPMRFLPVAEKSGLMAALDFWVLETACRQHARWQMDGLPAFILAINITKYSFMDASFLPQINQIVSKTGIDPKTIELEITEGALIEPSPRVIETIAALKHMGFTLAIDDFGTGYSSLAYLQRFNVDKLKIDRSFVKDVLTDSQGEAITSAIISMAKSLDLHILAEGVEDPDQLALLKEKGCEVYQGFYFSKPIEAPEFIELLKDYKP